MRNYHKDDMFNWFLRGLDMTAQATLRSMYAKSRLTDEANHRREMEQMKKEITEDVLSRISIQLDDTALKQLRDMLRSLGN